MYPYDHVSIRSCIHTITYPYGWAMLRSRDCYDLVIVTVAYPYDLVIVTVAYPYDLVIVTIT